MNQLKTINWPTADRLIKENSLEICSEELCARPVVSVCLITYNHHRFIRQAVESVLMQETEFPFEILIGDDHSTDGTTEILLQYQKTYPERIRLFLAESRLGEHTGNGRLNSIRLLRASRGKYIALLEGDDYWTDPTKLQKQIDVLERNAKYSVCFHKIKILENGKLKNDNITKVPSSISTIQDLAKGNYIHTCSCVFINKMPDILGPSYLDSPLGDYYIHMMNAQYGQIFALKQVMAVYRVHSTSGWSVNSRAFRIQKTLQSISAILGDLPKQYKEARLNLIDYCITLAASDSKNPCCVAVLDRIHASNSDVCADRLLEHLYNAMSEVEMQKTDLRRYYPVIALIRRIFVRVKSKLIWNYFEVVKGWFRMNH